MFEEKRFPEVLSGSRWTLHGWCFFKHRLELYLLLPSKEFHTYFVTHFMFIEHFDEILYNIYPYFLHPA